MSRQKNYKKGAAIEFPAGYYRTRDKFNEQAKLLADETKLPPAIAKLGMVTLLAIGAGSGGIEMARTDSAGEPIGEYDRLTPIDVRMFMFDAINDFACAVVAKSTPDQLAKFGRRSTKQHRKR